MVFKECLCCRLFVGGGGLFLEDILDRSLLLVGELVGKVHHIRHVQVSKLVPLFEYRHPFSFDAYFLPRFHYGRGFELHRVSIQVLYGLLEAHEGFPQGDVCGVQEVVSSPFEERMFFGSDHKSESAWISIDHVFSLFEEEDVLSIGHAGHHFHGEVVLFAYGHDVGALFALFGGVLLVHPGSHLSRDHFVFAIALARSFSGLEDVFVSFHLHHFTQVEVFERAFEFHFHIVSGGCLGFFGGSTESEPAEEGREDVLCTSWIFSLLVLFESFFTVLIVDLPLFGAGEHLVGVVDLRELLVGLFVPWVLVWMVLQGQLAIGFFDLCVGGGLSQSQGAVVIRPASTIARIPSSISFDPRTIAITPLAPPSSPSIPCCGSSLHPRDRFPIQPRRRCLSHPARASVLVGWLEFVCVFGFTRGTYPLAVVLCKAKQSRR